MLIVTFFVMLNVIMQIDSIKHIIMQSVNLLNFVILSAIMINVLELKLCLNIIYLKGTLYNINMIIYFATKTAVLPMGQRTLRNVNNYLNTNIYSYLETSVGQSSYLYKKVVHFLTPVLIRHLRQLKTIVFLHWCLICDDLLVFSF
jgi:hypothetical protein